MLRLVLALNISITPAVFTRSTKYLKSLCQSSDQVKMTSRLITKPLNIRDNLALLDLFVGFSKNVILYYVRHHKI